jgi:Protein of unknown function (DUF3592)
MSDGMIIGLTFMGAAVLEALIMGGIAAMLYMRVQGTANWEMAAGQVVSSQVTATSRRSKRSGTPEVIYTYSVMGQEFQSDKIFVGGVVSGLGARQTVERYPAGSMVQVFYDPQHPEQAVLERRSTVARFLVALGGGMALIFFVIGAGMALFVK